MSLPVSLHAILPIWVILFRFIVTIASIWFFFFFFFLDICDAFIGWDDPFNVLKLNLQVCFEKFKTDICVQMWGVEVKMLSENTWKSTSVQKQSIGASSLPTSAGDKPAIDSLALSQLN